MARETARQRAGDGYLRLIEAATVIEAIAAGEASIDLDRWHVSYGAWLRQRWEAAAACARLMEAAAVVDVAAAHGLDVVGRAAEQLATVIRWRAEHADYVRQWRAAHTRDYNAERRARHRSAFVAAIEPAAVFERDGWTCGLCGGAIDPDRRYPDLLSASVDHVIPLARGGTHEPGNVQAAHFLCNSVKGDRDAPPPARLVDIKRLLGQPKKP